MLYNGKPRVRKYAIIKCKGDVLWILAFRVYFAAAHSHQIVHVDLGHPIGPLNSQHSLDERILCGIWMIAARETLAWHAIIGATAAVAVIAAARRRVGTQLGGGALFPALNTCPQQQRKDEALTRGALPQDHSLSGRSADSPFIAALDRSLHLPRFVIMHKNMTLF